jgi:CHAD domain-containing protein
VSSRELLPPRELALEEAVQALRGVLAITEGSPVESELVFFDTVDALARSAGLSVVHERPIDDPAGLARLVVDERDGGAEQAAATMLAPTAPLRATELPPGPLRDVLSSVLDVRALLPLARVRQRTRVFRVLDAERKTVVRLTLEDSSLVTPSGWENRLRPRVRLEPVRGYEDELSDVRMALHRLGYAAAEEPLVDEAVRAAGGNPEGTGAKVQVKLVFAGRADAGAAAVLRRLAEVIEANWEGTIADIDPEFLHDLRVAVRRSRSVQRELKGVFPAEPLRHFRGEFKWVQQLTGDSRDLDVYVMEFDAMRDMVPEAMRDQLEPVLNVLNSRRIAARRDMVRGLRSERVAELRREWGAFLDELAGLPDDERPDAQRAIGDLSGARIRKVYRHMVRMGSAIGSDTPAEDYHELRKKGKELRYLLELFGLALFSADVVKPMIKTLKALQDVLGRHQDREVQVATLRALGEEVSSRPGGADALMAMGVLIERLGEDEQAARDEFGEVFADFAGKPQRRLVKETFT